MNDRESYTKFAFEGADLFYVELSMVSFKNYLKLIEDNFDQQKNILTDRYNQFKNSNEDNDNFRSPLHMTSEQLYELEEEFVQRFRQSLIIQLFSYVERDLKSICNSHSSSTESIYSIIDLKGSNDLDKIKKYMSKSMNIEIAKFSLWPFINSLRILRNKIVHEDATIQANDNDFNNLFAFAKNRFKLKSDNPKPIFYTIKLYDQIFLNECIKNVEDFMKEIMLTYKPIFNKV
ncbi:hypothetical protein [Chryseobacterium sp. G0201]|uniref:hypothetical protein n=1 Tax=Chryseobacterium sp. G0201 TaxID=2487065 RepID=UPI000F4E2667|nr:hypothetical protein [Chryseobacterium sp. G0201]AZA54041.1 hypothetical protein EG348_14055 [Chryseobacterium sp. G0201]